MYNSVQTLTDAPAAVGVMEDGTLDEFPLNAADHALANVSAVTCNACD